MKTNKDDRGWVTVGEEDKAEHKKGADGVNTFEVNGEVVNPYAMSKTHRIPAWVKAVIAKWWFPGAVFYLVAFGFGGLKMGYTLSLMLGLVWGAAIDIFLNHFLREASYDDCDYTRYIFIGRKLDAKGIRRYITLPLNLIYGIVLCFFASWTINGFIVLLRHGGMLVTEDSVGEFMYAVGPLLFATIMCAYDMAFTMLRNLIHFLRAKNKKSVSKTEESVDAKNESEVVDNFATSSETSLESEQTSTQVIDSENKDN